MAIFIRWEQDEGLNAWLAISGDMEVGMVVKRSSDGKWKWQCNALQSPKEWKHSGHVNTLESGKRSVERTWKRLIAAYGLKPLS